jgi:hypothetical protein
MQLTRRELRGAKSHLVRAAGPLGLYAAAWRMTQRRPRIFMYHRFAAVDTGHRLGRETFRAQIRKIRERCRIVTLASWRRSCGTRLRKRRGLP